MEAGRAYFRVADPPPEVAAEWEQLMDVYLADDLDADFAEDDFERYIAEHASKELKEYRAMVVEAYRKAKRNGELI